MCDTLSPYSTKKRVCVGYSLHHLTHEMYMPNAKTQREGPNATYIPLEMGFRVGYPTRRNLKKKKEMYIFLASPNAKYTNVLVSLR